MNNEVFVKLDRKEAEFLKNDVIEAISDGADMNKEWLVKLAAKLIEECEYADKKASDEENQTLLEAEIAEIEE